MNFTVAAAKRTAAVDAAGAACAVPATGRRDLREHSAAQGATRAARRLTSLFVAEDASDLCRATSGSDPMGESPAGPRAARSPHCRSKLRHLIAPVLCLLLLPGCLQKQVDIFVYRCANVCFACLFLGRLQRRV
jgi:hypothetical protein